MNELQGKVALVTGASKGIGAGIAKALAAAGAQVVVNYATSAEGANAVVDEIAAQGGRARAIGADISSEVQVAGMIRQTIEAFGRLDIVVNNAAHFSFGPVEEDDLDRFRRHFETNVFGAMAVIRQALPHLGRGASIINIGSAGVSNPTPNAVLYGSSKAAIEAVTRFLSKELGPRGIRVNTVRPGATDTEGNRSVGTLEDRKVWDMLIAKTSLGRIGTPEDIAPTVVFLASDRAGWVTDAVIDVSGGFG